MTRLRQWCVVWLVAAAVGGGVIWMRWQSNGEQERQVEALEREYQPVAQQMREIKILKEKLAKLQVREKLTLELAQERPMLTLLGHVSQAASKCGGNVSVQSFSLDQRRQGGIRLGVFILEGSAVAEKQWKTRLGRFGWLLHGVGFAVVASCAVLAFKVSLSPMDTQESNERIESLRQLLGEAGQVQKEHSNLTQTLKATERRATEIRQRIPDHPNEADFLKKITEAAEAKGLVISEYRRGVLRTEETHSQLDVQVIGEGSYRSICEFVDQVAALSRISKVKTLHINRIDNDQAYPVEITFVLYFGLKPTVRKG
ncbi:MAG: type 4a pilus biogenesis protein PilO [Planctomycetes bacterium]|nr:type 4a pilus biogenesis protein PilO [Planctomycetota bacterium]